MTVDLLSETDIFLSVTLLGSTLRELGILRREMVGQWDLEATAGHYKDAEILDGLD